MAEDTILRRLTSNVEKLARRAGVTIHWWPANRFTAMDDALLLLKARGYVPRTVIDVGANVGTWTDLTRTIFPDAQFHLIEPQPGCQAALRRFSAPQYRVHNMAVTRPGVASVRMRGLETTGASVVMQQPSEHDIALPATTLDALLGDGLGAADRTLLKLDVEGHELEVLQGAVQVVSKVEIIVCEVRFFDIESSGQPLLLDVAVYLDQQSFQLHDVAALASRSRDRRLTQGDVVFVRKDSPLALDNRWM